jgi:hypothetical protein
MKISLNVLIAIVGFLIPTINFGQAPDLGAGYGFALFTKTGGFTNVGATHITGDIGTNAGGFTGGPTIVGDIHISDAVSAQAATDVTIAYNSLSEVSCDTVIGDTLGNNQILTAKTYCITSATVLNGNLILDGQGDTNAVFIIKINGALSTSISSKISIINSAALTNVYWQINGAFSLGDSTVFKGNALVNGAIALSNVASLSGRGLSIGGMISMRNNTVFRPVQSFNPLPIELLSFSVHPIGTNVQLNWSTASEINNNYFTVQHTKDGINFEEVIRIPGAGNSVTKLDYSAIDKAPYEGVSYYRLMQTDFDGKFAYSYLVVVNLERPVNGDIYPNPFSTAATVMINDASEINHAELRLYTMEGTEVMNTAITKQLTTLDTSQLPSGIYFYQILHNDKIIKSGKLISQR